MAETMLTSCQSSSNKVENAEDKVQEAKDKVADAQLESKKLPVLQLMDYKNRFTHEKDEN